jgi:hypothetical protein
LAWNVPASQAQKARPRVPGGTRIYAVGDQHASPDGRRFIEQALDEIDPAYLGSLRAGAWKP